MMPSCENYKSNKRKCNNGRYKAKFPFFIVWTQIDDYSSYF